MRYIIKRIQPRLTMRLTCYKAVLASAILLAVVSSVLVSRAQLQFAPALDAQPKRANSVPGEILVRFRKESRATNMQGTELLAIADGRQIPMQVERLFSGAEIVEDLRLARVVAADTERAIVALRERADVLYAEPNFMRYKEAVPNDPRYAEQWSLKNTGQSGGFAGLDIKAEQAWDITTGSRNVVVGIVDEGIDINHPDLHDNIWTNPGEIPGNGIDDDGDGYVDDVHGWDFVHNDNTVFDYALPTYPPPAKYSQDMDDHGTHVAGTIGASGNNSVGVAGVNWQVSLMPLKFLGPNGGSSADLLKALAYAKMMRDLWVSSGGTRGANLRILNNSYGGTGFSQAELDAIRALANSGILFVVAAGNDGRNNDLFPVYPANYISPNVISVAASDRTGQPASFTNLGDATVHTIAPGVSILSTTPDGTYSSFSGTSMAAPHVSGTAALVCAAYPDISMRRLRAALLYSGRSPTTNRRNVDANAALQNVTIADTTPPGAVGRPRLTGTSYPNYRLQWTAPGDDGDVGQIATYEVRFSDHDLSDPAAFELARPLPPPYPSA